MPGLTGRSHTTNDVYKEYTSDDLLDEMYPPDGGAYHANGAQTPVNINGGAPTTGYTAMYGRTTPNGRNTPQNTASPSMKVIYPKNRPASCSRGVRRPASHVNVSIQDYYPLPPKEPQETDQRNYAIPEATARPTSPVQRILDRSLTQPLIVQSMPGHDMDPFTKQYYQRHWNTKSPATDFNLYRYGRAGGVWRHVRSCVANTGNQIAFIDGIVKEEDNVFFPPWVPGSRTSSSPFVFKPKLPPHKPTPKSLYNNKYSKHARDGFQYWYSEPQPIDSCRDFPVKTDENHQTFHKGLYVFMMPYSSTNPCIFY